MPSNFDCKVYVGDLGNDASKQELEEVFSYYGPLKSVWVARNPPGFAFVEFEDSRDAEDSVRGLDGRTICGRRARVELSTGKSRNRGGGGGGGGRRSSPPRGRWSPPRRGRPFHPGDRCYECGETGHYARDCRDQRRRPSRSGRSRSRSPRRRRSYTPSRSRSRDRSRSKDRSRSRDRSRTRSRSRSARRDRSRSYDRSRSRSNSRDRSPSRSVSKDRD